MAGRSRQVRWRQRVGQCRYGLCRTPPHAPDPGSGQHGGIDRPTVDVYQRRAAHYARARPAAHGERARALAAASLPGLPVVDLGCGPGGYAGDLATAGHPVIGVDAAPAMVRMAVAGEHGVRADLEALPFARRSLGGAWARNAYLHVPAARLPLALAHLHHALAPGAPLVASLVGGDDFTSRDDLPGRAFYGWDPARLAGVLGGAGFVDVAVDEVVDGDETTLWVRARRARTLPDVVAPGLRLLVCGLNPSLVAADAGYGYAGPSNRFWKAAVAAGLVRRPADPWRALADDGMGMTDLVKRATPRASELRPDEYRDGLARVARVAAWLRPAAVCFVGLEGWRAAVDRRAVPGWQPGGLRGTDGAGGADGADGVPAYVMPSTSGLNARTSLAELAQHLRAAAHPA